MKGGLGLGAAVLCMVVIACASGGQKQAMQAAPPSAAGGSMLQPEPQKPASPQDDEIDRLARDLENERVQLGLGAQIGCAGASCARNQPLALVQPTAECRPQTDTCKQSCTLSDSICQNAKKICDLADQLAGDDWAAKKCTDGNATCTAAKTRCCDCAK